MKVLVCHNFYQQPGGEDQVFAAEMALLRDMGDQVIQFTRDNKAVEEIDTAAIAVNAVWSRETYEALRSLANERAQAVKQWFAGAGGVSAERVFIVAPKLTAEGIQDKGAATRVDFALR